MISSSMADRGDRIESRRRFVVQDDVRLGAERPGDGDATPLPTGQLGRHPFAKLREPDIAQHFGDALVDLLQRLARFLEQPIPDVLTHRQ